MLDLKNQMPLSKFSENTDLHTLLYNSLIAETGSNSFGQLSRTAVIPCVKYQNFHDAKKPGRGPS